MSNQHRGPENKEGKTHSKPVGENTILDIYQKTVARGWLIMGYVDLDMMYI